MKVPQHHASNAGKTHMRQIPTELQLLCFFPDSIVFPRVPNFPHPYLIKQLMRGPIPSTSFR